MKRILVICVLLLGCGRRESGGEGEINEQGMVREAKQAGGIVWSYPAVWERVEDSIRVVTYLVPSYMEDLDAAECGVSYFGKDQGGTIDDNIQRWRSQFEGEPQANKDTMEVKGLKVTVVRISGTYLASGGSHGRKLSYKLMGSIVEAPDGLVFFKLTGPASLIEKSQENFQGMMQSITK